MKSRDTFGALRTLSTRDSLYHYYSLETVEAAGLSGISRLPYSLKILLENLIRHEDGAVVTDADIRAFARWVEERRSTREIVFHPSRIVLPDSSGIPLLADLAAMRDAVLRLGGDAMAVNPSIPVDLVVDHSVSVDISGSADALRRNLDFEYARNAERYTFLRWAQQAFANLRIVPPGIGIIHQVNLEYLASVVRTEVEDGTTLVFPECLIGADSHTPMVNALGVLGWGCGGLEAGAAMLRQPVSMQIPDVVGVRFVGTLPDGVTGTDLVLTVTQQLRRKGVVQKFVEFCGPGLSALSLAERATVANMAPEYGATIGFFPIDAETIAFLRASGRDDALITLVEAYARLQGLWRDDDSPDPVFTDLIEIDLSGVESSVAGPWRPHDRMALAKVKESLRAALAEMKATKPSRTAVAGRDHALANGDIVVAAITSCTNTSNPSVMLAAGLVARKATERGLKPKPWVKTSLAPGSRVVATYLEATGLQRDLDALGFHVVGFGCATCVGNSGPLDPELARAIEDGGLVVGAVLSGNRNFEARIHPQCRVNYLASPPLVVAYALAGTLNIDLTSEPLGEDAAGHPVHLRDVWPSAEEIRRLLREALSDRIYRERYADIFAGDEHWRALQLRIGPTYQWDETSKYIRQPPFLSDTRRELDPVGDISDARALAILGDSVTTDHISPIGTIASNSSAGQYLRANGVAPQDFNSFAARRVNHDVMVRGAFGNIRLRNTMVGGREGGFTRHMPDGAEMPIYEAAMRYRDEGVPLVIVAGRDYGTGSSRDWAAKGARLLGVRAVIAESFERIHRSNLIGMGVLPLQLPVGTTQQTLHLDGSEEYSLEALDSQLAVGAEISCRITRVDGQTETLSLLCRIDTSYELVYFRHSGIQQYVLRSILAGF